MAVATDVQTAVLDNGLRILTEAMPGVRSLAIGILVDAGPADEGTGQAGLAHLAEHLMFQGTASRSALDIARLMDDAGGGVGGFVTRDYTCYHATVLDDYCYHALDLLGDALLNSTFPEAAVEHQKEAILCELQAELDQPAARAQLLAKALSWPGHWLGRSIAGSAASLRRLTREDVIYFTGSTYTPDRMLITAAGNLVHSDFVAQARDAFWRLLGTRQSSLPAKPPSGGGVCLHRLPSAQAYFSLALKAFAFGAAERYALHVLSRLLGGGTSSRLFRSAREERGLAYAIGSEVHAYRPGGVLVIEGAAAAEDFVSLLRLTLITLGQLASGEAKPTEDEVARAKTALLNTQLIASESVFTRMSRLATQQFYLGRPLRPAELTLGIERVTATGLAELASTWLPPSLADASLAIVGPTERLGIDADGLEEMLRELCPRGSRPALNPKTAAAHTTA